jgi:hypothetical protein
LKKGKAGRELARLLREEGEDLVIRARAAAVMAFCVMMLLGNVAATLFKLIAGKHVPIPSYGLPTFVFALTVAVCGSYKIFTRRGYRSIREADALTAEYGTQADVAEAQSRPDPACLKWSDTVPYLLGRRQH